MVLVIDNFDSFTYNLVQLIGSMGQEVRTYRNDSINPDEAEKLKPDFLVVSPGPCTPEKAGISVAMIRHFAGKIPILGVCLGHQAVCTAFGGKIIPAAKLMHGKISEVHHDGKTIFSNLPPVISATRYHSLAVDPESLPECFEISARTGEGEIMGIRHRELNVEGVQFHPESIATETGRQMLENFLKGERATAVVDLKEIIGKLVDRQDLSQDEMKSAMDFLMRGGAKPSQIGAFITALRMKGETDTEIAAAAMVMRQKASRVPVPEGRFIVDTCGTGGDGSHTFNISTVAALIAAGAGVTIAKHGNRSVSSQCGSADVLAELGVNIGIDTTGMGECIKQAGIGFLFAPALHSAMKHVIGPRREIGIRTIFNILGPLANPALADGQVLGVFDADLLPVMAKVLKTVGTKRALIVHGDDGLDEITLTGKTRYTELRNGKICDGVIDPVEFGFDYCSPDDLKGGTVKDNARLAMAIITNREEGPKLAISLINAAAAIYVSGRSESIASAIDLAKKSVSQGKALAKLKKLKEVSNATVP